MQEAKVLYGIGEVVPWNTDSSNTGMEAKVVCLLGPDLLEAPGFGEFLDPECCV